MTKRQAVEKISQNPGSCMVDNAAKRALADGSDLALTHALVETKRVGQTLHVINIANEQLGYAPNDTNR